MPTIFKTILVSIITALLGASAFAGDADIYRDGRVDLKDLATLSTNWLSNTCSAPLWCDGCDIDHSGDVGLEDITVLGDSWLTFSLTTDIDWVTINDSGDNMRDLAGNLIYKNVFIAEISNSEISNSQYCDFLNAALFTGDIVVDGNLVKGAIGTNDGEDFEGKIYFDLSRQAGYKCSQIEFNNGHFSPLVIDGEDMANYPVVEVSWYGATAFCNYWGYHLPSEWQWQAAADFDGSSIYGCGITINSTIANYSYANPQSLSQYPHTSKVDSYPGYANLAGNVWEWTSSQIGIGRGIRGGSWSSPKGFCRVAIRSFYLPETTSCEVGFRVCR